MISRARKKRNIFAGPFYTIIHHRVTELTEGFETSERTYSFVSLISVRSVVTLFSVNLIYRLFAQQRFFAVGFFKKLPPKVGTLLNNPLSNFSWLQLAKKHYLFIR